MAKAKAAKRKDEVAVIGGGPYRLEPLPGARNIRTLSARYIADLQDHWERHGMKALDEYREKFVDRYVENYAMLARIIRVEADVKHSTATPKTVDEALAELESKVGTKGRRKFENFLREVGELDDEDEDVIDVESKIRLVGPTNVPHRSVCIVAPEKLKLSVAARKEAALKLIGSGMSHGQAARILGVERSPISKDVKNSLETGEKITTKEAWNAARNLPGEPLMPGGGSLSEGHIKDRQPIARQDTIRFVDISVGWRWRCRASWRGGTDHWCCPARRRLGPKTKRAKQRPRPIDADAYAPSRRPDQTSNAPSRFGGTVAACPQSATRSVTRLGRRRSRIWNRKSWASSEAPSLSALQIWGLAVGSMHDA